MAQSVCRSKNRGFRFLQEQDIGTYTAPYTVRAVGLG
jgi:hypothetical protein